jgi:hypothetical protein
LPPNRGRPDHPQRILVLVQSTTVPIAQAQSEARDDAVFVDRRALAFKGRGLCEALNALWKANGVSDRASAAEFAAAQQEVVLTMVTADSTLRRTVTAADLTPLLIGYCISARLPLPAAAVKTVTVKPGGVMLDFMISSSTVPPCRGARDAKAWS